MELKQVIDYLPYDRAFALKSCDNLNYGYLWRDFLKNINLDSPVEISCYDGKYMQEIVEFLDGNGFQITCIKKEMEWIKYKVVPL